MRVLCKPRIGGERWTVYEVASGSKHLHDDDDDGRCNGVCDYDNCKIYVNKDLETSAKTHAVLHELVHALVHVTGADKAYDMDSKKDEDLVSALTPALHRLLSDFGFHFTGLCT